MKVLVVGGGGREHALAAALSRSPSVEHVWCAPGNGGIANVATCLPELLSSDLEGLAAFAEAERIDLTVVGPEAPLVAGIADLFAERGLTVFGPSRAAAQLEGSKEFAKQVMLRNNVPTAHYRAYSEMEEAIAYVKQADGWPLVVKADGLAAGKGVVIAKSAEEAIAAIEDMMGQKRFGDAGSRVVIEEYLRGEEASVHAITDGKTIVVLPSSQDHKRIGDGDTGPNTGGMGAYSPAPVVEGSAMDRVVKSVLIPAIHGLHIEGIPFRGVLYAGLMMTKGGPRVLEFNVRFGDPETEVILPRVRSDLGVMLHAAATGTLDRIPDLEVDERACLGVVLASKGYPGAYQGGKPIRGLDEAGALDGVDVFHAGTRRRGDDVVTAGGRVLCVSALGDGLKDARDRAYEAAGHIGFDGMTLRKDIGWRAL